MPVDNPFVYGEVVPRSAFVDRQAEIDRLAGDLLAGQKVFLISPRRYGKASLGRRVLLEAERRGALAIEVTVSSYSSYVAFLEGYARALVSVESRSDKALGWLREMLGAVRPEVRMEGGEAGNPRLAVSFPSARTPGDVSRLAEEVFALPARIAEARRRPLAVALDEFQAIAAFDRDGGRAPRMHQVEHALRAAVQHQREVGYVFSGSEPSLMEAMLGRSRPFYKA
ncbi:MAG: ATP-binding protein, partial [Acidobacteria bacterium]